MQVFEFRSRFDAVLLGGRDRLAVVLTILGVIKAEAGGALYPDRFDVDAADVKGGDEA